MVLRTLAVLIAVSCVSSDLLAQRRADRGYSGITVYEHPDFRGTSVTLREEIPDLRRHDLNDKITSLEIDGNQAWELCQDVNFGGRCRVFDFTVEDLREEGWNDRVSSIRPVGFARGGRGNAIGNAIGNRGRGLGRGNGIGNRDRRQGNRSGESRLVLYDRPNFRGDARDVVSGAGNLGSIGNQARSVEVFGGTWELCEGASRNARCVTISEDVPDLRTMGLRNGVTSVRETGRQGQNRWW